VRCRVSRHFYSALAVFHVRLFVLRTQCERCSQAFVDSFSPRGTQQKGMAVILPCSTLLIDCAICVLAEGVSQRSSVPQPLNPSSLPRPHPPGSVLGTRLLPVLDPGSPAAPLLDPRGFHPLTFHPEQPPAKGRSDLVQRY
jgi:hypothetical protein